MKEAVSHQLYGYWNAMRGDRLAPKRFEIEPSQLAKILPDTFIMERINPETVRFRLAGTRICEAFATEFRGINVFDLFNLEDKITMQREFSVIARQGAVGVMEIAGSTDSGRTTGFEIVVTPLMHTRDVIDRYLGSITPIDPPEWLGSEPITSRRLIANKLIWPDGRPHAVIDAMARQSPFMPHMRNARLVRVDRRQFRVYDGGLSDQREDEL
ncbi:MAG: PAS domain-containing protein [Hyphomicrobiaceae bacterium]|nr:PAS domain-containing protein [Hyphomicrobiaceae bacterium]